MLKYLSPIFIIWVTIASGFGQSKDFTPTSFRGLEIDQSSQADVMKALGPPNSRQRKATFESAQIEKWLVDIQSAKRFSKFGYKYIAPYRAIDFYFLQDKLVAIVVYLSEPSTAYHMPWSVPDCPKILIPDDLDNIIGIDFKPFNGRHFPATLMAFKQYVPKPFRRDDYMMQYYSMTAISDRSVVTAFVRSVEDVDPAPRCSVLDGQKAGMDRDKKIFPGQVYEFQMISRSLEKK